MNQEHTVFTPMRFTLEINPVAKGRPRFGKGFAYTPARTRNYETALKILAKQFSPALPLSSALKVDLVFTLPRPKNSKYQDAPLGVPDVDNLIKAVTDAFNDLFWEDDSLIVELSGRKQWSAPGRPGQIDVTISSAAEYSRRTESAFDVLDRDRDARSQEPVEGARS